MNENNPVEEKVESLKRESQAEEYKNLAQKLGLDYVELRDYPISNDVLGIIPFEDAKKIQTIAYLRAGNKVKIASANPESKEFNEFINKLKNEEELDLIISVTSPNDINLCLNLYDTIKPEKRSESNVIEITEEEKKEFEEKITSLRDVKENLKKVSVTYLLDLILAGAIKMEASDIHIEPDEKEVIIRFRIDGVLHPIISIDSDTSNHIISRIKIMAKMKIDTNKMPQDGKFYIISSKKRIDIRVSTLPEAYGESLVMRIFDKEASMLKLPELGFSKEQFKKVEEAYKKTHGLIFVSGPTGSGKTTTLYAILDQLNKPGVKIVTLEDPIEYDLPGIVQSQIDTEKDYTFSTALRSTLRQDPDIVLIGEIRDAETGEMATQASLTGHLVLTTVHTNDAPSALHRLIDIGVRPFLIVDAINLIISQRLVRKICENCKKEYKPEKIVVDEIKKILGKDTDVSKLYRGEGCEKCHNSGYRGRIGIFELLVLNGKLRDLTISMASLDKIREEAKESGMETLEKDGLKKALVGLTTPEEIWRVAKG